MATPVPLSYNAAISPIMAGRWAGFAPRQLVADGIWTWFTSPVSVFRNGATYIMAVDSAGTCRIHKHTHATGVTESFSLSSVGLEVDDHNNGSILFLPDGRLVAFYGVHNDSGIRYRVSTNPENVSSWGPEQFRGTSQGSYSYPVPVTLSDYPGLTWLFNRRWVEGSGGGTRALSFRTSPDFGTVPAEISAYTDVWRVSGKIPYWRIAPDGVGSIHVFTTDMHPVQGQSSLYYFRADADPATGALTYRLPSGALITDTLPLGPSSVSQVYDGATTRCWVSDAGVDATGAPVCLWMRYPGNDGSQIEYWHARWAGSGWSNTKITNDGAGLYSPEVYYHGGMSFDSQDTSRVYLSTPVAGYRQVQEWRTSDNGVSWAKHRDITSGAYTGLRGRPMSPSGHNGHIRVIWFDGRYTSFTDYDTKIFGAG
jgi:hypothetical protein